MKRRAGFAGGALAVAAVLLSSAAPLAEGDRYSLAGGCYAVQDGSGNTLPGAERIRMQATALGSYLLYRPDGTFVSAQADGGIGSAKTPGAATEWRVEDANGQLSMADAGGRGPRRAVRFTATDGCGTFPEAELNAQGTPAPGAVPFGKVGGIVEGHMHWMTYEYLGGNFHCGRPWHPYGITQALPDCASVEGPQGVGAPIQNFLNFGQPAAPHDTVGWPTFKEWSADNLTYEGTYWRWIQRAWMGGLRLMVMSVNENRILCELQANRKTNCDEMDTVRRGFDDMRRLQDYVDAQAGGPGKGFFQIVTSPNEARRVINQGRMAIVLEVEISEFLGCHGWQTSSCTLADVDRRLDELHGLGVRSSLLLNKFDNPLTGVRFDGGPVGVLINAANRSSAGSFWSARTCTGPLHDNTIETVVPPASSTLDSLLSSLGVQRGTLPAYPAAPHCNTRGLTELGKHVVRRMMDLHMIVNPDHMSQAGVDDTLSLLEARKYSGVISPHGWMDPGNWPRLWKLGGIAFPGHSEATEYVKEWRELRPESTPYMFGWGYGADLGGLSHQPDPDTSGSIDYPFRSYDGRVSFDRQQTGQRTFDYNREGVANNYGLYADWFADLARVGGEQMKKDLWNGAEAYLEMWERAEGVPAPDCSIANRRLTTHGLGRIRVGSRWEELLRGAGQPQQRDRAWTWCVRGSRNARAADTAVLDDAGRVELVGSGARGRSAGGAAIGSRASALRGTRRVSPSIRTRRTRRGSWVFVVRRGRVASVAIASRSLAAHPGRLRRAVGRMRRAKASNVPRREVSSRALRTLTGRNLATDNTDPALNEALAAFCRL